MKGAIYNMPNPTISQIKVGDVTYDICDPVARTAAEAAQQSGGSGSGSGSSGVDLATVMNKVYPVGSIYLSLTATNPRTLFGVGTWTQLNAGYALWTSTTTSAYGTTADATNTGGHAITVAEMPSHRHIKASGEDQGLVVTTANMARTQMPKGSEGSGRYIPSTSSSSVDFSKSTRYTGYTGGNSSGTTVQHTHTAGAPKRIYVHAWKRTA